MLGEGSPSSWLLAEDVVEPLSCSRGSGDDATFADFGDGARQIGPISTTDVEDEERNVISYKIWLQEDLSMPRVGCRCMTDRHLVIRGYFFYL